MLVSTERLVDFVHETGIAPEDIITEPVVALPLPMHFRGKRFDSVEPDALWNPLFWLPEDIALRTRIRETDTAEPALVKRTALRSTFSMALRIRS